MSDSNRKWVVGFISLSLIMLLGFGGLIAIIDPYFHYHKPLKEVAYRFNDPRYRNDGILKHFDYDAIIIGTSMAENFTASEFNTLFHVNSVKVPFAGASYKEINDNLETAVKYNDDIRIILRCLDYNKILDAANTMRYDEDSYPKYLYDDDLFNDVNYLFNKTILLNVMKLIEYTENGGETENFDTYCNWMGQFVFGKEAVDASYVRGEKTEEIAILSEEDYKNIAENIGQNVTALAEKHPEIEFYLFFPPYSIYYWDNINQEGVLERQLDAEKIVIELLLPYENIHLFSFFTEIDMICDLDNYKDTLHYSEDINSQMLRWMQEGEHEITWENYEDYCAWMREFYLNYDYDALFDEE